ncbi:hypothetical protein HKW97_07880 [Pseudomonas luteola]|uniref:lipopolysaccharide biosynthesis protein n=1 Tax=Pseudomonas luteola TaxID=47886 RepID=UPI00388F9CC3
MLKAILKVLLPKALAASGTILLTLIVPFLVDSKEAASLFIGISLIYVLGIICRGGMDVWLLRYKSQKDSFFVVNYKDFMAFCLCNLIAVAIGIAYLFFLREDDTFDWVFLSLPAFSSVGLLSFYIRGLGSDVWASIIEVGSISLVSSLFVVVGNFFSFGFSIQDYFLISCWFVFIVNFLLIVLKSKTEFGDSINIAFKESLIYLFNQLISYLAQWLPIFFLGKLGVEWVVYFSLSNRIASVLVFIGGSIDSYSASRYSSLYKSNKYSELKHFRNRLTFISMYASAASFLFVSLFSLLYGLLNNFNVYYFLFVIYLSVCYSLVISLGPNGYYLMMTERGGEVLANTLFYFMVSLLLIFISYLFEAPVVMVFIIGVAILFRQVTLKIKVDKLLKEF